MGIGDNIIFNIQPVFNAKNKEIKYGEVLIREYNGHKGALNILSNLETDEDKIDFDIIVLNKAMEYYKDIQHIVKMTVNVMPESIKKKDFAYDIIDIVDKFNILHNNLIIEINEKTDFTDINVIENIKILNKQDFRIALDDFGTFSSNLNILNIYNIDIIKIDKSFIDNIGTKFGLKVVNTIVDIAQLCNAETIAEGVETEEQLNRVNELKCEYIQGFVYSKPVDSCQFKSLVMKGCK